MDNFLDKYQVPKLKHDQINHLNSPITPDKIEAVINSLPTIPEQDGFSGEFYQIFKDLIPILFKLFHKIGTQPNLSYEAKIMLITKPNTD